MSACVWTDEGLASSRASLAARFLVFLLWTVKMSDLVFVGRERPVEVLCPAGGLDMRDASCEVNARLVDEEISFVALVDFGRGRP